MSLVTHHSTTLLRYYYFWQVASGANGSTVWHETTMTDTTLRPEHSRLLQEMLKKRDVSDFFATTWQRKPEIFRFVSDTGQPELDAVNNASGDGRWNTERMNDSPLHEMVEQRWHLLRNLIHRAEHRKSTLPVDEPPLIFRERELQANEEVEELYGTSLFSPYLNGCSVVVNHGDLLSPWIAAACQDLQQTFPHAYANCYLTPPHSQAVPPHADDRDVFVIQLVGSKDWKVYCTVPVPFPYPHEQVGKQGLEIPKEVLDGPVAISTTLRPGDVLYMPRGFVHEAMCSDALSFHVTVALATHDWSLAGLMSMATESILTRTVDFRKSILPISSLNDTQSLQQDVDTAIRMFQEEITVENILQNLKTRLDRHNQRALSVRMKLIHEASVPQPISPMDSPIQGPLAAASLSFESLQGPLAAASLSFESRVRGATPDERASFGESQAAHFAAHPPGLHVRDDIADSIMEIVGKVKLVPAFVYSVLELRTLMIPDNRRVCDLTLLCLAKRAVEVGAFCVVVIASS